jgi:hypothetical protein
LFALNLPCRLAPDALSGMANTYLLLLLQGSQFIIIHTRIGVFNVHNADMVMYGLSISTFKAQLVSSQKIHLGVAPGTSEIRAGNGGI